MISVPAERRAAIRYASISASVWSHRFSSIFPATPGSLRKDGILVIPLDWLSGLVAPQYCIPCRPWATPQQKVQDMVDRVIEVMCAEAAAVREAVRVGK